MTEGSWWVTDIQPRAWGLLSVWWGRGGEGGLMLFWPEPPLLPRFLSVFLRHVGSPRGPCGCRGFADHHCGRAGRWMGQPHAHGASCTCDSIKWHLGSVWCGCTLPARCGPAHCPFAWPLHFREQAHSWRPAPLLFRGSLCGVCMALES